MINMSNIQIKIASVDILYKHAIEYIGCSFTITFGFVDLSTV